MSHLRGYSEVAKFDLDHPGEEDVGRVDVAVERPQLVVHVVERGEHLRRADRCAWMRTQHPRTPWPPSGRTAHLAKHDRRLRLVQGSTLPLHHVEDRAEGAKFEK